MKKQPRIKKEIGGGSKTARSSSGKSNVEEVSDGSPTFPDSDVRSAADYEKWVVQHASHFTVSKRAGPGAYETSTWATLALAIKERGCDTRKMVYAVTASGRSAMISAPDYDTMLKLRGEG